MSPHSEVKGEKDTEVKERDPEEKDPEEKAAKGALEILTSHGKSHGLAVRLQD